MPGNKHLLGLADLFIPCPSAPNLVFRANALEEQLKEQELRAQEMVLEEARKQKELLCKMEREKSIEIENLQARWARCWTDRRNPAHPRRHSH
jgi:hypothetical protein